MSDTPRTDAVSIFGKFQSGDGNEHISEAVPAPFARQLERELSAKTANVTELTMHDLLVAPYVVTTPKEESGQI